MARRTESRIAIVIWLAGTALAAPVPSSQGASTAVPAPGQASKSVREATAAAQHLRVGDVRIEGKVYSPQALFIVSRPADRFDHAVAPRYLQLEPSARLLPYRLRPEILHTHRAALEGTSPAPLPEESPRRSP